MKSNIAQDISLDIALDEWAIWRKRDPYNTHHLKPHSSLASNDSSAQSIDESQAEKVEESYNFLIKKNKQAASATYNYIVNEIPLEIARKKYKSQSNYYRLVEKGKLVMTTYLAAIS